MKYQHFILSILAFILFASLSSADRATNKMTVAEHLAEADRLQAEADKEVAECNYYHATRYYYDAASLYEAGGKHEKAVAMRLSAAGAYQAWAEKCIAQGNLDYLASYYSKAATSFKAGGEHEKAAENYSKAVKACKDVKDGQLAQNCRDDVAALVKSFGFNNTLNTTSNPEGASSNATKANRTFDGTGPSNGESLGTNMNSFICFIMTTLAIMMTIVS